jgi:hypothetical protein
VVGHGLIVPVGVLLEIGEVVLDSQHRASRAGEIDHRTRPPDRINVRARPPGIEPAQDFNRRLAGLDHLTELHAFIEARNDPFSLPPQRWRVTAEAASNEPMQPFRR